MRRLAILAAAICAAAGCARAQPYPVPAPLHSVQVLGYSLDVNVDATGDTVIPITAPATRYIVGGTVTGATSTPMFLVGACSGLATTFQSALYTGPNGTGTGLTPVATSPNAQPTTMMLRPGAAISPPVFSKASQPNLYFNVSTPQGSAMTCDVFVMGIPLP